MISTFHSVLALAPPTPHTMIATRAIQPKYSIYDNAYELYLKDRIL